MCFIVVLFVLVPLSYVVEQTGEPEENHGPLTSNRYLDTCLGLVLNLEDRVLESLSCQSPKESVPYQPCDVKNGILPMRKQRHRPASQ